MGSEAGYTETVDGDYSDFELAYGVYRQWEHPFEPSLLFFSNQQTMLHLDWGCFLATASAYALCSETSFL